jgi:putative oxidoreductase
MAEGLLRNFDITNGVNILRLICGLFFIPHVVAKFTEPATLNFFKEAEFNPPAIWMYIDAAIEILLSIGLVLAIYTPQVALLAAAHLFVAAVADWKVARRWIWVAGGVEYPLFSMLCCFALTLLTWRNEFY